MDQLQQSPCCGAIKHEILMPFLARNTMMNQEQKNWKIPVTYLGMLTIQIQILLRPVSTIKRPNRQFLECLAETKSSIQHLVTILRTTSSGLIFRTLAFLSGTVDLGLQCQWRNCARKNPHLPSRKTNSLSSFRDTYGKVVGC